MPRTAVWSGDGRSVSDVRLEIATARSEPRNDGEGEKGPRDEFQRESREDQSGMRRKLTLPTLALRVGDEIVRTCDL